ncbi:MAG: PfkB family carbohydrate kinase [Dehalococcoidia bacterium]|nr:PfkB family carbohydrate kinase [Dehalococcoidia bacterium]
MSLLVVGSVAYDSVETPAGSRNRALGGSAMYFSVAASCLTEVSLVGIVGEDFEEAHVEMLESRQIDVSGLERAAGKTFHWSGVYSTEDVNQRETLDTQLNVFEEFRPTLNRKHSESDFVFLANIDPALQKLVLEQMERRPRLVALDSMNFWIEGRRDDLDRIVREVDLFFLDEGEARSYAGEANIVRAARRIQELGPRAVVVKRGEHGVLIFDGDEMFSAPAFPLDSVVDPTGAGDSFAGGFMGVLAATEDTSHEGIRRAAIVGSIMGSFAVQDFSADRLTSLTTEDIQDRFDRFIRLTQFDGFEAGAGIPGPRATVR